MTDIVERMKAYIHGEHDDYVPEVLQLACAEIERLRGELERSRGLLALLLHTESAPLASDQRSVSLTSNERSLAVSSKDGQ
jgi:hypothetical protein